MCERDRACKSESGGVAEAKMFFPLALTSSPKHLIIFRGKWKFWLDKKQVEVFTKAESVCVCVREERLTGHAEVFGLLGLMPAFGAGWSFSFFLFKDFTLRVVIAVAGLVELI